jgi:hypothetical protein
MGVVHESKGVAYEQEGFVALGCLHSRNVSVLVDMKPAMSDSIHL